MRNHSTKDRLDKLEKAMVLLEQRLALVTNTQANWLDKVSGSMAHIPKEDFDEFVRLGAKARSEADQTADEE